MLILLETMAEERRTATAPELLEPLMARLAGGDQEALAELYHRTRTSVYGLALSYLKNRHDAEDVTQDAFVRAWENAHQYRPQGTPLAWLLTIARNLALMKLRERGRTQDMALEDWERLAAENPMVTVEDRQVLDAALTALADDERLTGSNSCFRFCKRQAAAGADVLFDLLAGFFFGRLLVRFLAEAVVRAALFAQELGVFSEEIPPLRLDIRTHGTADIGTFVVG